MATLSPGDLRTVWAAYMADASARREPIPFTKGDLLKEIENLDAAIDKDEAISSTLRAVEVEKLADRLDKVRTGWTAPAVPFIPDPGDLAEMEINNG